MKSFHVDKQTTLSSQRLEYACQCARTVYCFNHVSEHIIRERGITSEG